MERPRHDVVLATGLAGASTTPSMRGTDLRRGAAASAHVVSLHSLLVVKSTSPTFASQNRLAGAPRWPGLGPGWIAALSG